jgi:hypothetical protein
MKSKKAKTKKGKGNSKKMIEQAGIAMKHEFYLEASLLLTAIFERKLDKLIEKAGERKHGPILTLTQVLRKIKQMQVSSKYPVLSGNFDPGLIDRIRRWKSKRHRILKDLTAIHVSEVRQERNANEGIQLYKELTKTTKSLKSKTDFSEVENEIHI